MNKYVGAFEAKTHFSALLERAERGEEIIITRRGKVVAKLTPAVAGHDPEQAKKAVRRIRSLAEELKLGAFDWDEWKDYRDQGRP